MPPFVADRGVVVERGVPAMRVVEAFNVLEDGHPGLGARAKRAPVEEFALEAGEEALTERVGLIDRLRALAAI